MPWLVVAHIADGRKPLGNLEITNYTIHIADFIKNYLYIYIYIFHNGCNPHKINIQLQIQLEILLSYKYKIINMNL